MKILTVVLFVVFYVCLSHAQNSEKNALRDLYQAAQKNKIEKFQKLLTADALKKFGGPEDMAILSREASHDLIFQSSLLRHLKGTDNEDVTVYEVKVYKTKSQLMRVAEVQCVGGGTPIPVSCRSKTEYCGYDLALPDCSVSSL